MRRALASQPGIAVVWNKPTRVRTKSSGLRSERRSPPAMARCTRVTKALWIMPRVPSMRRKEPPATVSMAGKISRLSATWSMNRSIHARRASSGGLVGREAPAGCSQFFDLAAIDGFDQGVAGGKVTVERAWADARLAGDVVECSFGAVPGKGVPGNLEDALTVALRVGAGLAWERRRQRLRFRHTSVSQKHSATGDNLHLSYKRRLSPLVRRRRCHFWRGAFTGAPANSRRRV